MADEPTQEAADQEEPQEETTDERVVVAFDEGSFVRSERKALQARYNRHFDDLLLYIDSGLTRRDVILQRDPENPDRVLTVMPPEAPEPIRNLDGSPAFADDVLIAMLTVVAQRENPAATEAMFDDYTTTDLLNSIRAGKAQSRRTTTKT